MTARTIAAVLLVFTLTSSASAECAWVLWEQDTILKGGSSAELWSIADTAETKSACEARGAEMLRTVYSGSTPGAEIVTGPMWAHERWSDMTKHIRLRCLPDTVDPRGPKGSGR